MTKLFDHEIVVRAPLDASRLSLQYGSVRYLSRDGHKAGTGGSGREGHRVAEASYEGLRRATTKQPKRGSGGIRGCT